MDALVYGIVYIWLFSFCAHLSGTKTVTCFKHERLGFYAEIQHFVWDSVSVYLLGLQHVGACLFGTVYLFICWGYNMLVPACLSSVSVYLLGLQHFGACLFGPVYLFICWGCNMLVPAACLYYTLDPLVCL